MVPRAPHKPRAAWLKDAQPKKDIHTPRPCPPALPAAAAAAATTPAAAAVTTTTTTWTAAAVAARPEPTNGSIDAGTNGRREANGGVNVEFNVHDGVRVFSPDGAWERLWNSDAHGFYYYNAATKVATQDPRQAGFPDDGGAGNGGDDVYAKTYGTNLDGGHDNEDHGPWEKLWSGDANK